MNKYIKTVLFDAGNVLCTFDKINACQALTDALGNYNRETVENLFLLGEFAVERDTGKQSASDFYQILVSEFGLDEKRYSVDWLAKIWGDIFSSPPQVLTEAIQQLREDVMVHIASNTEELHWPFLAKVESVEEILNRPKSRAFKSYEIGYMKPDSRFYENIFSELEVSPQEVLFIDDLQENRQAFEELGGVTESFNLSMQSPSVLTNILNKYNLT